MAVHRDARDRHPWKLHLELDDLAVLRHGCPADPGKRTDYDHAFRRLHDACIAFIRGSHAGALSEDDSEDIFHAAITDAMVPLQSPEVALEDLRVEIERGLNRHKRREQRYKLRHHLEAIVESGPPSIELHYEVEHARSVMAAVDEFMTEALESLDDGAHDLLVMDYELDAFVDLRGVVPKREAKAHYAALAQARIKFWAQLERLLRSAAREPGRDVLVLNDAHNLLVGGTHKLKRALAAVQDLEDPLLRMDE